MMLKETIVVKIVNMKEKKTETKAKISLTPPDFCFSSSGNNVITDVTV